MPKGLKPNPNPDPAPNNNNNNNNNNGPDQVPFNNFSWSNNNGKGINCVSEPKNQANLERMLVLLLGLKQLKL